ncbi:MAG: hypothetical protein K0S74_1656 [Chlamydiales bacterium]|jgi:DNA-binding transcriptional LysR family regulator|nr:hypothetical protein [Chlamydiales bacterium]
MNLTYLKYFYDAALHRSISVSAKINFVTQSAISQGIRKLEEVLQKDLITHQKNQFKLTTAGETVFHVSKQVFQAITHLQEQITKEDEEYGGTLTIACSHSIAISVLPKFLLELKKHAPKIVPQLLIKPVPKIKEALKRGEAEIGIVLDNDDYSAFEVKNLLSGEFHFYQSSLVDKNFEQGIILPEESKETNLLKQAFQKKYGYSLPVQMEVSSWEVVASLIEKGLGVGFIPDYLVLNNPARMQLIKTCDFLSSVKIPYLIQAIYYSYEGLSKNAKLLLTCSSVNNF